MLADKEGMHPTYLGLENAMNQPKSDVRIFGKPTTRPYRRMAVALTYDNVSADVNAVKERAIAIAKMITVESK